MKYSLKIKNIMFQTGFMKLVGKLFQERAKNIAILRYHAIVNPEDNYYTSPSIAISPAEFEKQIRYLSENYNIISLDEVADSLNRRITMPERAVVLTFDDGYKDNFYAYKIMKEYSVCGTFYVAAGCLGDKGEILWLFEIIYLIRQTAISDLTIMVKDKTVNFPLGSKVEKTYAMQKITEIIKSNNLEVREDIRSQLKQKIKDVPDFYEKASQIMLNWEQVREMSDNGMIIGGHTMTHLNLPNADYEDAVYEICECKKLIEKYTGKQVRHFSYPNGGNYDYYNNIVMDIVKNAGYITSATSNNGLVGEDSDLFELRRIRITPYFSEVMYQMECEDFFNKMLGKT